MEFVFLGAIIFFRCLGIGWIRSFFSTFLLAEAFLLLDEVPGAVPAFLICGLWVAARGLPWERREKVAERLPAFLARFITEPFY